jgi:hypothetical protein
VLAGNAQQVDPTGSRPTHLIRSLPLLDAFPAANCIIQPSTFYRRSLLTRTPPLDESLHYVMDFELWNLFRAQGAGFHFVDEVLSIYEFSPHTKSGSGGSKIVDELESVYRQYTNERIPLTWWYRKLRYPVDKWVLRRRSRLARNCVYWPIRIISSLALMPFYRMQRVLRLDWLPYAF